MDGKEIDYREKYERLGKTNEGEIVAVVSNSRGETHVLGESYLLKDYKKAATLVELLPGDEDLKHVMAISQEARTAIQSYKLRHRIALDTPPVSETPEVSPDEVRKYAKRHNIPYVSPPSNDETYGADILMPSI